MKDIDKPFCVVRDDGWIYCFNKTKSLAESTVRQLNKFAKSSYRVEENPKTGARWFSQK